MTQETAAAQFAVLFLLHILLCPATFSAERVFTLSTAMSSNTLDHVQWMRLKDVHPLHGGHTLWLLGDGTGICQVVVHLTGDRRRLHEKRYRLTLSMEDMRRITGLARNSADADSSPSPRPGHFDETKPSIHLAFTSGRAVTLSKWLHDHDSAFDPLYAAMLELIQSAQLTEPIYQGLYESDWSPQGFAAP